MGRDESLEVSCSVAILGQGTGYSMDARSESFTKNMWREEKERLVGARP